MNELLDSLSPTEQHAIRLIKLSLDCYNTRDGYGLFTGPGRYGVLQGRIEVAAVQARTLFEFWSILLRKMLWETPPKAADAAVLSLIEPGSDREVLRVMANETASIISAARMLHDEDKGARRALQSELEESNV